MTTLIADASRQPPERLAAIAAAILVDHDLGTAGAAREAEAGVARGAGSR